MLRGFVACSALTVSLLASPKGAQQSSDGPAVKVFKTGVSHHNRFDYVAAAKAYREALSMDSQLVSAAINLAIIHEKWRETEIAQKLYDDAVRVAPRSFAARYNRGQFLQKRGDLSGARADYAVALQVSPSETSDAARPSMAAATQPPPVASLYVNLAAIEIRLFEQTKDVALLASAEQNLRAAERLRSKSPALYFNRARLLELANHPAGARTLYEEAMRRYAPQSEEYKTCLLRAERLSRQLSH